MLGMDSARGRLRISLAGMHDKAALLRLGDPWHRPQGATPTSHILELPIGLLRHGRMDLRDGVENEWLCLRILEAFGLQMPRAAIEAFDGIRGPGRRAGMQRTSVWRSIRGGVPAWLRSTTSSLPTRGHARPGPPVAAHDGDVRRSSTPGSGPSAVLGWPGPRLPDCRLPTGDAESVPDDCASRRCGRRPPRLCCVRSLPGAPGNARGRRVGWLRSTPKSHSRAGAAGSMSMNRSKIDMSTRSVDRLIRSPGCP